MVWLLLALAAAGSCLDGGNGDPGELDPGLRLGLAAPSRDDPVPKIEPMALTRIPFRGPGYHPFIPGPRTIYPGSPDRLPRNRPNINFRLRFGPDVYGPGGYHPRGPFGPVPVDFNPNYPDFIRRPILIVPTANIPRNIPNPVRPGGFLPGPLHPEFRPGTYNNGFHPVANGPIRFVPRFPAPGGYMRFDGLAPRQPNYGRPDFNSNNRTRNGDHKKDLPEGTVGVSVSAVNQTEQGSVHANVTVFVVPKQGDNKETLQVAAKSVLDGIFNKNKDEDRKTKGSNDLEHVLNKINLH